MVLNLKRAMIVEVVWKHAKIKENKCMKEVVFIKDSIKDLQLITILTV